jgi:hypothetical protein
MVQGNDISAGGIVRRRNTGRPHHVRRKQQHGMSMRKFSRDTITRILVAWAAFAALFYIALWAVWNNSDWATSATYIPYDGSIVIAAIVIFMVLKFYGTKGIEGRVWLMMTVGITFWLSAELVSGFDELAIVLGSAGLSEAAFQVTDYLFITGYVFVILAFIYKARYARLYFDSKKVAIITGLVLAFSIISAIWVAGPTLASEDLSNFDKTVNLAYVVLDLILVGLGAVIALYWGKQVSKGWHIISAAILLMTIADIAYAVLAWEGIYFDGNFIELAWVLSYLLLGLGAHYQKKLHESFM